MNATTFRRVNGWLTAIWLIQIPIAVSQGWVYSVAYVSAISIYANVVGHLSTWQAARVEEQIEAS